MPALHGHLNFIVTELHKGCVPLFDPAMTPDARETVTKGLKRKLEVMEQILADGRLYLTGPDFTVADAYLFTNQIRHSDMCEYQT